MKMKVIIILIFEIVTADLVVNVRNQGGEVYKEEITSDVLEETINLYFESPGDGAHTRLFIDFKNEIQIIQRDTLGDEDTGYPIDPLFMSYCFVTKFIKSDFIPPDAMAKLRQKNPWSIRLPERSTNVDMNTTLDTILDVTSTDWLSPHLKEICKDSLTYSNKLDLLSFLDNNSENYMRAVRPVLPSNIDCNGGGNNIPCSCSHHVCIGWFPCALKYCRSKGENNSSSLKTYRCGIHTCKTCRNFIFTVSHRGSCL